MIKHLLLTVLLLAMPLLGQQPTSLQKPQHPRKDTATIAKEAKGAVVSIVMADKGGNPIAQGSGFLVSRDGWVVTNYHVIKSGSSAVIKLPDGPVFVVDGVLAFDKDRDVAVIKAHGNNFQTVVLGDSDRLEVGEEVVAIGSPLSLESTVSNGIVSGIRSDGEGAGRKLLQITAPISHGSSGGALFNLVGEVVGITSSGIQSGENLNFAVPINDAKRLLQLPAHALLALPDKQEAAAMPKNQVTAPRKNWKTDLQQTTDWLHDFVEANGFIDFHFVLHEEEKSTDNSYLTFNGCHGIIRTIFKSETNPSDNATNTIGFNLGDIDPDTVDSLCSGEWTCSEDFKTTNFKKLITVTRIDSKYPDGVTIQSDWSQLLTLSGNTSGPRFAKALRHAVVLCGGKASTF